MRSKMIGDYRGISQETKRMIECVKKSLLQVIIEERQGGYVFSGSVAKGQLLQANHEERKVIKLRR